MKFRGLIALAGVVVGSGAFADPLPQAPLVTPLHDVDIDYVMTGASEQHLHQRMRWSSTLWRQRIDMEGAANVMLTDYRTHTLMMLDAATRTATVTTAPGGRLAAPGTPATGLWRQIGPGHIAGEDCTIWESADTETRTTAFCYTADGLMLGATHGGKPFMEAVSVRRAPQPSEIFDPPPGYHRADDAR